MTDKVTLTNARVAKLKAREKRYSVKDVGVPGLAVYVAPGGTKSFFVYHKLHGRPHRELLGSFPSMTVEAARKGAKVYIGDVAAGRTKASKEKSGKATVADLFQHYLEVHAKPRKRTWERDVAEFERLVRKTLGNKLAVEVTKGEVASLLNRIQEKNGKGPARKVRALLHKMYEVALDEGWCQANPVRGTARPEFDARQRYLKPAEVKRFVKGVATLTREVSRDFIWLALHTGQRKSNVCMMRWDETDFDRATWTIPASKFKGKKAHVVPLTDAAMAVLKRRWDDPNRDQKNPWVLPGHGSSGHYAHPKEAWNVVLKNSGLTDLRIHDLRRSMGSWMQAGGANLRTIQHSLGHGQIGTTARTYAVSEVEQVRAAMAGVSAALLKAARQSALDADAD